jgi:hypothetical protein
MGVREDRLQSEYDSMQKFRSDVVTWEPVGKIRPPDHYRISYNLRSIIDLNDAGQPQIEHRVWIVEIRMPANYPWGKPEAFFVGDTVYHPNVWKIGDICIEDEYQAGIGVPLDVLCEHIGKMIAYQEYNLGSPANDDWRLIDWLTRSGETSLPTDDRRIRKIEADARKARISFGDTSHSSESGHRSRIKFGS